MPGALEALAAFRRALEGKGFGALEIAREAKKAEKSKPQDLPKRYGALAGLSMRDDDIAARSFEQGYRGPWYHGGELGSEIQTNFAERGHNYPHDKLGLFMTNDPEVAASYGPVEEFAVRRPPRRAHVEMPQHNNHFDGLYDRSWDSLADPKTHVPPRELRALLRMYPEYAEALLRARGLARIDNIVDPGSDTPGAWNPSTELIVKDPSRVRRSGAVFDWDLHRTPLLDYAEGGSVC